MNTKGVAFMKIRMADWSLLQNVSSTFCTGENMTTCVAILSQELQVQGFPPLPIRSGGETDNVALVNALHEIQSRYQKERNVREELENRHHRLSGDLEHQKGSVTRLKYHLEQVNKELSEETEKLRQITNKYKLQSAKLKTEKEEVKRLNLVLKSRDIKYKHEIKKNEQELAKLKERLHQLMSEKSGDRSSGLELINVIQRSDGKRGTWNTRSGGKQEEEMYQGIMARYEERHQELMCENTQLRDCLYSMQKNLAMLINRPDLSVADMSPFKMQRSSSCQSLSTEEEEENEIRNGVMLDDLSDNGYFHLPIAAIQNDIEKKFLDTCEKIKRKMNKQNSEVSQVRPAASRQLMLMDYNSGTVANNNLPFQSDSLSPSSNKPQEQFMYVSQLQQQVLAYKDIIQKQEELLNLQVKAREQENIERQQKLLDREKCEIEEKRIQYSLASAELDRQRQKLEEEKYLMLQQEFLNMSPFKDEKLSPSSDEAPLCESVHRNSVSDVPHVRLLPATPVLSSAHAKRKPRNSTEMLRARISSMFSSEQVNDLKSNQKDSGSKKSTMNCSRSLSASDISTSDGRPSPTSLQNLTLDQLDILKQSILLQSLSKSAKTD